MTEGQGFEARCEQRDGVVIVIARGELDLESAGELTAVLGAPGAQAPTVILDLRDVTFIDSSGLSVLVGQHQRARAEQFRFVVAVGGARAVARVIELSGLREMLAIVEDPAAVLTA
jgi:anti-anti-sigma factor